MGFTDPSTSVWHKADLLNELVDAINKRYLAEGWSNTGDIVAQVVANTTIVQRATFWNELQGDIENQLITWSAPVQKWVKSYSAGTPLGTPAYYDGRATVDRYLTLSDVFESLGKTGSAYQDGEGGYSWRRRTPAGWQTAGNLQYGDVISNYLVEDLQAVLKALIWTQGGGSAQHVSWDTADWSAVDGYGQGFDADRVTALNLAIAAYATGVNNNLLSTPGGVMKWDGNLRGQAAKTKGRAWIDNVREDGFQKDIYLFAYVVGSSEWSDQGEGVTEDVMHHFETLANITNGNNGARSFKTVGHFGADDWANSPTDKPSGVNSRGWYCGDSPVVIDWRDGFDYY